MVATSLFSAAPVAAGAGRNADWPAYLFGPAHTSFNANATAIGPADVAALEQTLIWTPPEGVLDASPTVYHGRVYIGTTAGTLFAMDEDGSNIVSRALDTAKYCGATRGIVSTAAVAVPPGSMRGVLYVAGARKLYALDPDTLEDVHAPVLIGDPPLARQGAFYVWSSPAVAGGRIYLGITSANVKDSLGQCALLSRGSVEVFRQSDLHPLAIHWTAPATARPSGQCQTDCPGQGGDVWSSVGATKDGSAFVAVGNEDDRTEDGTTPPGESASVIRLDGATLARGPKDRYRPPGVLGGDNDFGASPTLFTAPVDGKATRLVASCNKNGVLYAMRQADLRAGPVWQRRVGNARPEGPPNSLNDHCQASVVADTANDRLYIGANSITIGGRDFLGSVQALNPSTGKFLWRRGLPSGPILGTPSLDGAGVLAAATWDNHPSGARNFLFLLDAATGKLLRKIATPGNSRTFPQPVFADDALFLATEEAGLYAFRSP
jgi:outer membrane protein assembly factor BamB